MNNRQIFIFLSAVAAIAIGLASLQALDEDLRVDRSKIDEIPVTVFRSAQGKEGPVILIAHGFAGSQQLMQPMAATLAHSGYTAVTFDFAGHGRNEQPLSGGIKDFTKSEGALNAEIARMIQFAHTLSGGDQPLGLVGHSMASDLVIHAAIGRDDVAGVVALSAFGTGVTATEPRNLLIIDGAWEPEAVKEAGLRIINAASSGPAQEHVAYGDVEHGTARRFVLAGGAEHIGVIYSQDGLTETRDWMNAVFGRTDKGLIDRRGKWLGLLFLGLVALAYSLSCLLPAISAIPLGAGLGWKRQWPVAVAPALLTPLILWKAPTDFLPILLGDYLAMHFALYGMLTGAGLWLSKRPLAGRPFAVSLRACALPAFLIATTIVFGLGAPIDLFVTSFAPTSLRWILIPIMFCCTSIYFLTDEWLTRGDGAARGGPLFTRFCFLVSLGIAVALNPQKLFFLIIIIPVIFIFFCIFGLFSRWTYARTRDPRVAAFGNAAGLAWAICVTFPIVGA